MSRPVYSNIAFTLFTYALGERTGKNYAQLLRELITEPFGMPSIFPSPGNDSLAVISPVSNSWGVDYGDGAPAGGLVSTVADLSVFLYAILDWAVLSTPTAVREWLQPRSFAGSPYSFVGTPWEIFRPALELLFPGYDKTLDSINGGHTVTINAKGGVVYGTKVRYPLLTSMESGLSS